MVFLSFLENDAELLNALSHKEQAWSLWSRGTGANVAGKM